MKRYALTVHLRTHLHYMHIYTFLIEKIRICEFVREEFGYSDASASIKRITDGQTMD